MERAKKLATEVWDKIFGKEIVIDSWDIARQKAGTKYTVKKHCDGHWTCSCMSFRFHSGTYDHLGQAETCKHIRHYLELDKKGEL